MSGFAPLQDTDTGRSSAWSATGQAAHVVVTGGSDTIAGVTQYGYFRVTNEPTALFTDSFDTLDTTNKWTTKVSTGTTTVVTGNLVMQSSTTASAYAGISTQASFLPDGLNFLAEGMTMIVPNVVQANTLRFWGWGAVPATPTVAVPTANGVGFELDGTGVINAVIYQNSVKTNTVATNYTATNNLPFYTAIARRADRIDFYINSTLTPVATVLIPALDVATLPGYMIAINAASAPAAAAQLVCTAFGIGTTGCNTEFISDPVNPQWRANVTKPSTAVAATQSALAVALHPTSALNGQSAHDAVVAGNPVRQAGRALTAAYTSVATGDTADLITTVQGVQIIRPYQIPELEWSYAAASGGITNTTDVALAAAAGAGLRRYVTSIGISNASAVATEVVLKDGSTVIWRGYVAANAPLTHIDFSNPLKTTANAALNVACITTASAIYINAQGYTAP